MFGKCVVIKILIFLSVPVFAAQNVTVTTDGAMVYKAANFDAPVIGYFSAGKRVRVSTKKFGGAFHRVRFRQGVLGYISDVDFRAIGSAQVEKKKEDKVEEEKPQKPKRLKPLIARTYLGAGIGITQYTEIINKTEFKEPLTVFGLKYTTPFSVLDGPFLLDAQVFGSPSAPKYYDQFSTSAPKGFVLIGAIQILYPLSEFSARRGLFYVGAGPSFSYTNALLEYSGSKLDLTELRAGVVFSAGLAFDMGGPIFKLEPKFFVEKASYSSLEAAIQLSL